MFARIRSLLKPAAPRGEASPPAIDAWVALLNQGRQEQAIALITERLRSTEDATTWLWLARAYVRDGRTDDALEAYDEALDWVDDDHVATMVRGERALTAVDGPAAESEFRRAVALHPADAEGFRLLGSALALQGRHADAESAARAALALAPNSLVIHSGLCAAVLAARGLDAACIAHEEAIRRFPGEALLQYNFGVVLSRHNRKQAAVEAYARAIELNPDLAPASLNLALDLFILGRYESAGTIFERRWDIAPALKGVYVFDPARQWRGEPLAGKRILLWAEQGLGDTLQMMRYLPFVVAGGAAAVHVKAPATLLRLLRQIPGVDSWIDEQDRGDRTQFDLQCPLMSLPHVFGTTLSTVPPQAPPLVAPPELAAAWRVSLGSRTPGGPLRVGLVWSSGLWGGAGMDLVRIDKSIALAQFAPLTALTHVEWYCLQVGAGRDELAQCPAGLALRDPAQDIVDFADTAAIIDNLDLVLSVDTSVVHLAGAAGKPVIMLLKHTSGMFWLLDRDDSPWYPSLRIVRQNAAGDWHDAILRAADLIRRFAHTGTLFDEKIA